MDPNAIALILSRKSVLDLAHSAYPDAPVVEERVHAPRPHRPHAVRTRNAVASLLHHTADALAPARGEAPDGAAHGAW
jgi:hypothetical protein